MELKLEAQGTVADPSTGWRLEFDRDSGPSGVTFMIGPAGAEEGVMHFRVLDLKRALDRQAVRLKFPRPHPANKTVGMPGLEHDFLTECGVGEFGSRDAKRPTAFSNNACAKADHGASTVDVGFPSLETILNVRISEDLWWRGGTPRHVDRRRTGLSREYYDSISDTNRKQPRRRCTG